MAKRSSRDDRGSTPSVSGNWSGWSPDKPDRVPAMVSNPTPVHRQVSTVTRVSSPPTVSVTAQPRAAYDDSWSRSFTHGFHDVGSYVGGQPDPNSPNLGMEAVRDHTGEVTGYRSIVATPPTTPLLPPVVFPPRPGVVDPAGRQSVRVLRRSGPTLSIPRANSLSYAQSPDKARDASSREERPDVRCKPRPKDNTPKGRGGLGKPRRFIPWCDR